MTQRWHVLGVGAIGGLFACRLQGAGADVTLLTRDSAAPPRQLILKDRPTRTHTFAQQSIATSDAKTAADRPIERLLVCTKAWAAEDAIRSVAPDLSEGSTVVLLCNGMGLAESVAPLIRQATLILGSTTSGCRRTPEGELILSGEGNTQLGAFDQSMPPPIWLPDWQRGVPDCLWEPDIRSVLLAKVALNAVINPLTAIHGVSNGDLFAPLLREITAQSIEEVQRLLLAAGEAEIAATLPHRVRAVCEMTASNHSSMRVDMESGKRTEIDAIVGWLLTELVADPPATPHLRALYDAVKKRSHDD